MRKLHTAAALALIGTLATATVVTEEHRGTPAMLRAEITEPWQDTDGDLLPDALEWVSLTSPYRFSTYNQDSDDFLDVIDYVSPGAPRDTGRTPFSDHSARLMVHGVQTVGGSEDVYLSLLVQLVGTAPVVLSSLEPFVEVGLLRVPIANVLSSSRDSNFASRLIPGKGTLLRYSFRLASVDELRSLLPCTVGVSAVLDGKHFVTGSHLAHVGNSVAVVVAVDSDRFAFQALVPPQDASNPFWRGNHACMFRLVQIGVSRTQSLCEIVRAECEGVVTLYCDPQGCRSKEGALVPLPIGLRLLRGG